MKHKLAAVTLLTFAACDRGKIEPPQRVNIEVTGSPECLARVVNRIGLSAATMPLWSDHIGTMEFGPVEAVMVPKAVDRLRTTKCMQSIKQRPCANPLSDVDICNARERHS